MEIKCQNAIETESKQQAFLANIRHPTRSAQYEDVTDKTRATYLYGTRFVNTGSPHKCFKHTISALIMPATVKKHLVPMVSLLRV